jgi:hypothetical protein
MAPAELGTLKRDRGVILRKDCESCPGECGSFRRSRLMKWLTGIPGYCDLEVFGKDEDPREVLDEDTQTIVQLVVCRVVCGK